MYMISTKELLSHFKDPIKSSLVFMNYSRSMRMSVNAEGKPKNLIKAQIISLGFTH